MQQFTVFFSWQSERSDSSKYIREALIDCVKDLSESFNVDITVRDADEGNRGAYDINNAVIRAISDSDVTVADLTPTSHGNDSRANPNANALFEYATARALKGHERVLAVADISADDVRKFPFDFNHNSMVTFRGLKDDSLKNSLKDALGKIVKAMLYPVLYDATTVFFSQRIAQGFPGVRGLKVYDDPIEIGRHLDAFFKHPIVFGEAVDREGDPEPLWWFRGGEAEAIDSYERLLNGVTLIDWNELKIRRIAVYSDSARYYSEYLYIEADAMPSVGKDGPTAEHIKEIADELGYCTEEYAVVRQGNFTNNITRQQYDDGYAEVEGRIVPIRDKATLRCRYLSPVNFIVAAKFSAYNCDSFNCTSREYFDNLLNGIIDLDEFHDYLMTFPKPDYR